MAGVNSGGATHLLFLDQVHQAQDLDPRRREYGLSSMPRVTCDDPAYV